jgi:stringent starvation protein B
VTTPAPPDSQGTPTRPYLIRALHDWCTDNGYTPYVAVYVDASVQVPMEYVKNNEIVLNVGFEATSGLKLGNQTIEFKARFGGAARDIVVPVDHVVAIYARENGQGMAFPMPTEASQQRGPEGGDAQRPPTQLRGLRLASSEQTEAGAAEKPVDPQPEPPAPGAPGPARPTLKRIK